MTVAEAARLLEVKESTVYALCRESLLGHKRIGVGRGTIRIDPEDVEVFLAAAREKGANPAPKLTLKPAPKKNPVPVPADRYVLKHIKPRG
jgi:excisionase family DNA binding protein